MEGAGAGRKGTSLGPAARARGRRLAQGEELENRVRLCYVKHCIGKPVILWFTVRSAALSNIKTFVMSSVSSCSLVSAGGEIHCILNMA